MNTIRFYIILKQGLTSEKQVLRLNTIRFYIILKQWRQPLTNLPCLNTIRFYIILKPERRAKLDEPVWILYVFTSFSNRIWKSENAKLFEYYTFLHHSQTSTFTESSSRRFEYYTFLHHSQTSNSKMKCLTRTYIIVFTLF